MQQRLKNDLKTALKAGEKDRLSVLRLLISGIQYAEIERKKELTEGEIHAVIQKAVRDRVEAAGLYRKGGREELAAKEVREMEILKAYLPEPLSGPQLEAAIEELMAELSIREKRGMGQLMKALMAKFQGRIDGSEASRILAAKLT